MFILNEINGNPRDAPKLRAARRRDPRVPELSLVFSLKG
jgi:hypothetical protein